MTKKILINKGMTRAITSWLKGIIILEHTNFFQIIKNFFEEKVTSHLIGEKEDCKICVDCFGVILRIQNQQALGLTVRINIKISF